MLGLIKILIITAGPLLVFGVLQVFAPAEIRGPALLFLVGLVSIYNFSTFRNWRLRRKLERISRENMKRMRDNN